MRCERIHFADVGYVEARTEHESDEHTGVDWYVEVF